MVFALPTSLSRVPPARKQGLRIRRALSTVQTEHLLPIVLHSPLNRRWKTPVDNSWLSLVPLLVLGQRRGQARGQIDAKIVGKQHDDEENVTELISE